MRGVTISAAYGAGGSVVAARVAQLLDVPLLDRAISSAVAEQLRVSVKEARDGAVHRSLPDRVLRRAGSAGSRRAGREQQCGAA